MSITMEKLGKKLGLSRQTISRVVNNELGIKPDTRQKVLQAIEKYNYKPNLLARGLAKNRRDSIGVAMTRGGDMLYNPYFSMILGGITIECQRRGITPLIYFPREKNRPRYRIFEMIEDGRIDGGLIIEEENIDRETLKKIEKNTFPIIILNSRFRIEKINWISADDRGGTYKIVEHLVKHGHREIVYFRGFDNSNTSTERIKGYRKALEHNNIEYKKELVINSEFRFDIAYQQTLKLIEGKVKFSAVACGNDLAAWGVIKALTDKGISVPEDKAVVGYDDFDFAERLAPPLTTVKQPLDRMGALGVSRLIGLIEGKKRVKQILETELVIRKSCGCNGPL